MSEVVELTNSRIVDEGKCPAIKHFLLGENSFAGPSPDDRLLTGAERAKDSGSGGSQSLDEIKSATEKLFQDLHRGLNSSTSKMTARYLLRKGEDALGFLAHQADEGFKMKIDAEIPIIAEVVKGSGSAKFSDGAFVQLENQDPVFAGSISYEGHGSFDSLLSEGQFYR